MWNAQSLTRRHLLRRGVQLGGLAVGARFLSGCATAEGLAPLRRDLLRAEGPTIDLEIANSRVVIAGRSTDATTVNGGVPGPEIRLREGDDVTLRVTNRLEETSSIHWHGLLVPPGMDGVPGISFDGILPGETFVYQFPIRQSGTYWYHSHSGLQEQTGVFGALIIEPKEPDPIAYDRAYTIVLSDWTFEDPHEIIANLKKYGGYYNFQRRTLANVGDEDGSVWSTIQDRLRWSAMGMDAADISDVTGQTYTYLMNGLAPTDNWTGAFEAGQRVRLRIINASAATYFDVRIPGVPMTVVEADGQNVQPVETDELRIAIAETYDVIVQPPKGSHCLFAEAMDRSGHARGTLSSAPGRASVVPARRKRPLLDMSDMGMSMAGMDMGGMKMDAPGTASSKLSSMSMGPTSMPASQPAAVPACAGVLAPEMHGPDTHGAGNTMVAGEARAKVDEAGVGLRDATWRVLTYAQLRRTESSPAPEPTRDIELHLTGNMERYMWSFDGVAYDKDMPAITLKNGERVRFKLLNDTMMAHPIHLHGTFFELDVGACADNPLKHTVNVKPAELVSFVVTATEVGRWAFHCHILYHMEAGMFRVVEVLA